MPQSIVPIPTPNTLIVTPDRNHHGNDWSGAFKPEANRLVKLYGLQPSTSRLSIDLDGTYSQRRQQFLNRLERWVPSITTPTIYEGRLEWLVFLCHGWATGTQFGWAVDNVSALASFLTSIASPTLKVTLYACSTGDGPSQFTPIATPTDQSTAAADALNAPGGDGGFADKLRDHLSQSFSAKGIHWTGWVDAHDRRGHCTSNPYVRRFYSTTGPTQNTPHNGLGADYLIPTGQPPWDKWNAVLHDRDHDFDPSQTLRLRYPLMTHDQIVTELTA